MKTTEQLTRRCIEILSANNFPGCVSFLTKSILIKRDLSLIKALKNKEVGMTITGLSNCDTKDLPQALPHAWMRSLSFKNGVRYTHF
jgi:DNA repair photolyase